MIFQNEKTPFQAIKTRSPKSLKIDIFPKGVEASNVINDPKCNKGPKCNNFWP